MDIFHTNFLVYSTVVVSMLDIYQKQCWREEVLQEDLSTTLPKLQGLKYLFCNTAPFPKFP